MKKITDNSTVAMKNDIIPTLAELRLTESRLFQYCLAHYDSRGDENPTFDATVNNLREYFDIDKSNAYVMVRQAMMRLSTRPLEWRENNVKKFRHWFDGFNYHENEGRFEFKINKDAEPFFLMIKKFFTRYRLGNTKKFKRAASFKLYVNLKQWENTGRWEVELDELKYRLGVTGKYPRFSSLRERVIAPAIDEINEHSDLHVTWKAERYGRRTHTIIFAVRGKAEIEAKRAKEVHEMNEANKTNDETRKALDHIGFDDPNYIQPLSGQRGLDF